MDYQLFLDTTRVVRMLYGLETATLFFEKNIGNYDKIIDISSLIIYNKNNKNVKKQEI